MAMNRATVFTLAGLVLLGLLAVVFARTSSHFDPPQREGPPLLVSHAGQPVFWILLKREERRQVRTGFGRFATGTLKTEIYHHFELHAHDPVTTAPLWHRTLLTLHERDGGRGAQARILGQDGEAVWLFLADGAVALAAGDGAVLANRAAIEERNPRLRGLLPAELRFYAFHEGLLLTAADATRYTLRAPGFVAGEPVVLDPELLRRVEFMAQQWNGGYRTPDFLLRARSAGGRLVVLYSAAEASEAAEDPWGDNLRDPSAVRDEGSMARRTLWTVRRETRKPWPDRPAFERIAELAPLEDGAVWLQGGFLKRAGAQEAFAPAATEDCIIVHASRLDTEGRVVFTRLDADYRRVWDARLPLAELGNRWELGARLLLYGSAPFTRKGATRHAEYLLGLDLASGAMVAWDIAAGASLPLP